MSIFSNLFPRTSGTAHNGPQPPPAPAQKQAESAAAATAEPPKPTSSLDKYTSLWQTPTTEDGKPVPLPVDALKQPMFNFDAGKVTESAGKMDFTSGIDPELLTKATSGDQEAFLAALNHGIRNAVIGMTMSNGNLINTALLQNNERITASLPTHIKGVHLMEMDPTDNPVFSHPAAQPLVQALKKMAFARDPNADPKQINRDIAGYLSEFASELTSSTPTAVAAKKVAASKETNWLQFAGVK